MSYARIQTRDGFVTVKDETHEHYAGEYGAARAAAERASKLVAGSQSKTDAQRYALNMHMHARNIAKKNGMTKEAAYHQKAVEKHLKPVNKELSKYLGSGEGEE